MATYVARGFTTEINNLTPHSSYVITRGDSLLAIPDGVYRPGDIVPLSLTSATTLGTFFVGYVAGTNNPVFLRSGTLQYVILFADGTDPGGNSYDPGDASSIVEEPLGVGPPIVFADVGFRDPLGSTRYASQDKEIEFDRGVLEVNGTVTLRTYTVSGGTRTLDQTFDATFLGRDSETGDLIFDPPSNINGGRNIVAASVKASSYQILTSDIVAEAWPPDVTFTNYGIRQGVDPDGNFTGDFTLQGTSPGFVALDVPDGVYRVGDMLTIRVFGGVGGGESVEVEYLGFYNAQGNYEYPIFEAADFEGSRTQFIGARELNTAATYEPPARLADQPFGAGVARFADYGLRRSQGETDVLNSQDREIEFDYDFLTLNENVTLRIYRVSGDERTLENTIQARYAGFDRETGDPIFSHPEQNDQPWANSRQIIAASVKASTYEVPHGDDVDDGDGTVEDRTGGDIIAEAWPPPAIDATYTNYGFRQGANLENSAFDLQGTGVISGLHVPTGIYRKGNTYDIEFHGGTADGKVTVTFVGYVTTADGTEYPIFEHADFKGMGRAQFIGTSEPHETETYMVASGDITDDEPLGIGVARFADYGLRIPQGGGETDNFNPQDREIEFDYDLLTVGKTVELRIIFTGTNGVSVVEQTVQAQYAGFDRETGDPLFNHPEQNGQPWSGGRQIIAASVKASMYVVPHGDDVDDGDGTVEDRTGGDIIAESWPPPAIDATTFSNYGLRRGANLENSAFDLQGDGRNSGLDIPDGAYRSGEILTIQLFGGTRVGEPVEVTYRGYVIDDGGDFYPIFEAADFRGQGRAQFIGTNEAGTGGYTVSAGDIVFGRQLWVGFNRFSTWGGRAGDTGDFAFSPTTAADIRFGIYEVGNIVTIRLDAGALGIRDVDMRLIGYEADTFYPIFRDEENPLPGGEYAEFILIDETGSGDYTPGQVVTNAPYKIGDVATFSNYGFRQEADLDGDLTLQGDGRNDGLDIQGGVYRVGDTLTIQPFGGAAAGPALEVTFRGYVVDDGEFYPIFDAADFGGKGPARFIGTDETGTGSYSYTPDDLVTDMPFAVGDITFDNFGIGQNQDGTGTYTLDGNEITFAHGIYRANDEVTLTSGDRVWTGRFVGFENRTVNAIFWVPASGDQQAFSLIATNEPGTGSHTVPDGGVITDVAYETDEPYEPPAPLVSGEFRTIGTRLDDGAFELGESGIVLPERVYEMGDTITLTVTNIPTTFTFTGYERDTFYPIFETNNYLGIGLSADLIATNEVPPTSGTRPYTAGNIITDTPFELGAVRFTNVAILQGDGPAGTYQFLGSHRDIPAPTRASDGTYSGEYGVGDTEEGSGGPLMLADQDGNNQAVEFVGYQTDTNYPIFKSVEEVNGEFLNFLLTDETSAAGTTLTLTDAEITTSTYTTCFAPGTWIATPAGECAVETLKPGDVVLTAHDGVATVKWVGVQKVPTMFGAPELTRPVRIMAGALDDNVPHTDLVVTKDHGMIVDGVICQAGALINGTSIIEVPGREPGTGLKGVATYYHVETHNHVPLLANGAAAESFIDNVDRARFGNHSEFVALYGSNVPAMTEMTLPRAMSARQVPKRISSRLDERADMSLGSVVKRPVAGSA